MDFWELKVYDLRYLKVKFCLKVKKTAPGHIERFNAMPLVVQGFLQIHQNDYWDTYALNGGVRAIDIGGIVLHWINSLNFKLQDRNSL